MASILLIIKEFYGQRNGLWSGFVRGKELKYYGIVNYRSQINLYHRLYTINQYLVPHNDKHKTVLSILYHQIKTEIKWVESLSYLGQEFRVFKREIQKILNAFLGNAVGK